MSDLNREYNDRMRRLDRALANENRRWSEQLRRFESLVRVWSTEDSRLADRFVGEAGMQQFVDMAELVVGISRGNVYGDNSIDRSRIKVLNNTGTEAVRRELQRLVDAYPERFERKEDIPDLNAVNLEFMRRKKEIAESNKRKFIAFNIGDNLKKINDIYLYPIRKVVYDLESLRDRGAKVVALEYCDPDDKSISLRLISGHAEFYGDWSADGRSTGWLKPIFLHKPNILFNLHNGECREARTVLLEVRLPEKPPRVYFSFRNGMPYDIVVQDLARFTFSSTDPDKRKNS